VLQLIISHGFQGKADIQLFRSGVRGFVMYNSSHPSLPIIHPHNIGELK